MSPDAGCRDLLMCAYSLTNAETEIMAILMNKGDSRVEELAAQVHKDKSTVYRSLQKLVGCRLVFKEKRLIEKGGYFYVYKPLPPDMIKEQLKQCANSWHKRMLELSEFVDTFSKDEITK